MAKKRNLGILTGGLSHERKLEILGVLVIAVAILLGISIVTYHPGDYELAHGLSFSEIFSSHSGAAQRIRNGLGILGAY
jgi:S-DNA-T family DNA segregation ATPase FtsK/SpoIIIE